jgi:sporulation protein YlmC with PRC-barrel domain
MKNLIAVALLGTAIASGAAYAQTAQPADRAAPAATTSPAASSDKMMLKGKWRASKLMGLDVYNEANEKLGDINELVLDKDGKVHAVVIGDGRARHRRYHGQVEIYRGTRPHQLHGDHDARNHNRHSYGAGHHYDHDYTRE